MDNPKRHNRTNCKFSELFFSPRRRQCAKPIEADFSGASTPHLIVTLPTQNKENQGSFVTFHGRPSDAKNIIVKRNSRTFFLVRIRFGFLVSWQSSQKPNAHTLHNIRCQYISYAHLPYVGSNVAKFIYELFFDDFHTIPNFNIRLRRPHQKAR